jgi:hypothetical protein
MVTSCDPAPWVLRLNLDSSAVPPRTRQRVGFRMEPLTLPGVQVQMFLHNRVIQIAGLNNGFHSILHLSSRSRYLLIPSIVFKDKFVQSAEEHAITKLFQVIPFLHAATVDDELFDYGMNRVFDVSEVVRILAQC